MAAPTDMPDNFYENAKNYWSKIPATVEGMLGGFSEISFIDIHGSKQFLQPFLTMKEQIVTGNKGRVGRSRAVDCGAGIGRITKQLLVPFFDSVDMVEVNPAFLAEAPVYMGDAAKRVGNFICTGLQEFTPEPGSYDVIWCQWVLGHLTDADLVAFLQRCRAGLREHGIIVVKDNMGSSAASVFDADDSSFTRPRDAYMECMHRAGLRILKEEKQRRFPKEIYEVRMFALQ
ncbi:PREDICTED: N-terminal Xaa-Pro-Lys N-methyltransferase 1-A-like isoform X2 [Priapulus caudatus]|uniref:Alpha N-terminal protein methyltransferase 1 n=1 Tax=Priapulus caudatus TaxID=37621 RepID=A0ABM1EEF5_PRICU|nr:PREDICTED: N-terminal Xaa-Pro-Lys N-methyltransferase 1-A-like isoform X2 [Priapulus caudatus]